MHHLGIHCFGCPFGFGTWSYLPLRRICRPHLSQDRTVKMYEQTEDGWNLLPQVPKFEEAVWRLSWNVSGTILAITTGDNKVCPSQDSAGVCSPHPVNYAQ